MKIAYKVAAAAVRQRFAEQRPDDLAILNSISESEVAAYAGDFDQVEKTLKCLNIPAVINPNAKKLTAQIVFVNCSRSYDPQGKRI